MATQRTQEEILQDLLEHLVEGLGLDATVEIESNDEALIGTLRGEELGIFIGRHGQTIDAVQHLAQRILLADPEIERRRIVVDAEGYRARRREALEKQADQAAIEAEKFGRPIAL
ncbi:MAG: spoIIIJ-associated protein, partial [Baekduia sp.]|nr:spoIIIJ-associated protein [Baekduia sp.]